jgi:hypothetical protein
MPICVALPEIMSTASESPEKESAGVRLTRPAAVVVPDIMLTKLSQI